MTLELDLQIALDMPGLPAEIRVPPLGRSGAGRRGLRRDAELTIRIVNEVESTALNETYRHKQGPTNVLSFPSEAPPEVESALLGDIVICAPVVLREAISQEKPGRGALGASWSRMAFCTCWAMIMMNRKPKPWNPWKSASWRDSAIPDPYGDPQDRS
jgi:probable rRNA maturation factor